MSAQNKAVVEQAYNNFKSGDIEGLLNLMADDISWTLPAATSPTSRPFVDGKAVEFQEYMDTAAGIAAHRKAMSARSIIW